jgi:glycosyltransferase involved in cell wall biosynthesis
LSKQFDLDVLLPFHKIDSHLEQAIDSILKSERVNLHLILIDDRNCLDETPLILPKNANITLAKTSGLTGYGESLRIGSKYIESEFVALMNSDDLVNKSRFHKQLIQIADSDLNICKMRRITSKGWPSFSVMGQPRKTYSKLMLGFGSLGADATWLMKSNWWRGKSFFDNQPCLDWRIALKSFQSSQITFTDEFLYQYRRHPGQTSKFMMSRTSIEMLFKEWKNYMKDSTGIEFGLEEFYYLAVPWIRRSKLSYREILELEHLIKSSVSNLEKNEKSEIVFLMRRRRLIHVTLFFLNLLAFSRREKFRQGKNAKI